MKIINKTNVYIAGANDINTYRIPSIIRMMNNELLAFCEGRKESMGDSGSIGIYVKRSSNNGETWSDQIEIISDGVNTFGNPNPVMDRNTGKIHLLCNFNYSADEEVKIRAGEGVRICYHLYSEDNGYSWSKPRDITSYVKKPDWSWHAAGPCHAIQTNSGCFVFGGNHAYISNSTTSENYDGYSFTMYSDDNCQTFKVSPDVSPETNECSVAQLKDGRLYINMRSQQHNNRFVAYSNDDGANWTDFRADKSLLDPHCQGSTLAVDDKLYFCNDNSLTRDHLTLRVSNDNGKSWGESLLIHEGHSAYSDLVQIDNETIGCLYEYGDIEHCYEKIGFAIIKL